jgi:hypothetical protein
MTRFRPFYALLLATGLLGPAGAQEAASPSADEAAAGQVPAPYDCTLREVFRCQPGSGCAPAETLGEMSLPARVLVNFEQQVIAGVNSDGLPHVSTITDFARSGDILVMLGIDGGTGWMMHGTANDDEVTFVAASDDFVLNAFGACKAIE